MEDSHEIHFVTGSRLPPCPSCTVLLRSTLQLILTFPHSICHSIISLNILNFRARTASCCLRVIIYLK